MDIFMFIYIGGGDDDFVVCSDNWLRIICFQQQQHVKEMPKSSAVGGLGPGEKPLTVLALPAVAGNFSKCCCCC